MGRARGWLVLMAAFLIAGTACASNQDRDAAEVFRLTEIGGQALPATYPEEEGCEEEISSATLFLYANGEWEMEQAKREICGDEVEQDEDIERGTYVLEGATYRFSSPESGAPSPGELEVESLTEGSLTGGVLTARLADGTTVVFRRQTM